MSHPAFRKLALAASLATCLSANAADKPKATVFDVADLDPAVSACAAFDGRFTPEEIKKWLIVFLRRFFSQQFKRSCLPDGPRIGSVSLSPRGDWRMPSDASAALWLAEAEAL